MSQKGAKKKREVSGLARRKERRFKTLATFMATNIAIIGMIGSLILGAGVFALWVLDPPLPYASYMVAAGGLGLGLAFWFAQPRETAVAVGDAGIAVEDGSEVLRVHWHEMKSLRVEKGSLSAASRKTTVSFTIGANPRAAAFAIAEARTRIPGLVDIDQATLEKLPALDEKAGAETPVDNDQVAGLACASSGQTIRLEEDARICQNCGQVYDKEHVPATCTSCEASLEGRVLRA